MLRLVTALAFLTVAGPADAQEGGPRHGPPPTSSRYVQYGVAISSEAVLDAGDVCPPNASAPCILGSGVGPTVRVGYRARGPWYVGGAYEFSRQESSNLLRLAILQQLRAETRYYANTGSRMRPYGTTGLGAVLFGNEWGTETGGVTTFLGGGLEFEVSRTTVIGAGLFYRLLLLRGWTDSADQRRADRFFGFGLAHIWTIEVAIEARGELSRW